MDEIVRRGRVRGFIPWLISQRPAVIHKDVLSQIDIMIAMKLTSSQDRAAMGGWIEGQADREAGKDVLATLPQLQKGQGFIWHPGEGRLERVQFPRNLTFDSSRTPKRGEIVEPPVCMAKVRAPRISEDVLEDRLAELASGVQSGRKPSKPARKPPAAAAPPPAPEASPPAPDPVALAYQEGIAEGRKLERAAMLAAPPVPLANDEASAMQRAIQAALGHLVPFARRGVHGVQVIDIPAPPPILDGEPSREAVREFSAIRPSYQPPKRRAPQPMPATPEGAIAASAVKLLAPLAMMEGRLLLTWQQVATLAGLKPTGGHFNSARKTLRHAGAVQEISNEVFITPQGAEIFRRQVGDPPAAPATRSAMVELWCGQLTSPAPDMLRTLAATAGSCLSTADLAAALGKAPSGGHWNSGLSSLRKNGLIETRGTQHTLDARIFRS
jgi:hypothetical protein